MFSRINIFPIIRDHFKTLYDHRPGVQKQPFAWGAFFGFFGIPLVCGIALYYFGIKLGDPIRNGLLTALTLLAGLMLNLQAIAYSMIGNNKRGDKQQLFSDALRDTCSNISYSVLVAILSIVFLILPSTVDPKSLMQNIQWIAKPLTAFLQVNLYFLLLNTVLTLCMILRRIHILMMEEIKENRNPPAARPPSP